MLDPIVESMIDICGLCDLKMSKHGVNALVSKARRQGYKTYVDLPRCLVGNQGLGGAALLEHASLSPRPTSFSELKERQAAGIYGVGAWVQGVHFAVHAEAKAAITDLEAAAKQELGARACAGWMGDFNEKSETASIAACMITEGLRVACPGCPTRLDGKTNIVWCMTDVVVKSSKLRREKVSLA